MKRITIDCQDKRLEAKREEIERFLKSLNLTFRVVGIDNLILTE
jgi:hypothetical protein